MKLLTEIKRDATRRSGISVVEVLSAIVVAMIGVFGVMILIPFAVQQAQSGLDRNDASVIGRNAFEQFEIEGFRFLDSNYATRIYGRGLDPANVVPSFYYPVNPVPLDPSISQVMVVDPLFLAENTDPTSGFDPYDPTEAFCGFGRFNLSGTDGKVFNRAMARQMCRSTDDMQFQSPLDNNSPGYIKDIAPPQPIFDILDTGDAARRQSLGRISWNAVLVPVKSDYYGTDLRFLSPMTPRLRFRMHVLVHKDRDLGPLSEVVYPRGTINQTNTGYSGGTVEVHWPGGVDVRRDDWVMLKNTNTNPAVENGYRDQVGFYRVTGVFYPAGKPKPIDSTIPTTTTLTLDGPDFGFANGTEIYHLVGQRRSDGRRSGQVINVFERTTQWEQKSNWN